MTPLAHRRTVMSPHGRASPSRFFKECYGTGGTGASACVRLILLIRHTHCHVSQQAPLFLLHNKQGRSSRCGRAGAGRGPELAKWPSGKLERELEREGGTMNFALSIPIPGRF